MEETRTGREEFSLAEIEKQEVADMFGPGFDLAADLTEQRTSYCSFEAQDDKSRALLFNLTNQTPESVGDHIGEEIDVTDVYIEILQIQSTDDITGEVTRKRVPRVVLITKDGKGYGAVSIGIYKAVKTMFAYFGQPGVWEQPRRLKLRQINRGERRLLTFDVLR